MTEKKRGFALLTAEERAQISSKGGKAAQKAGTAHRYTHEEAVSAGKKGGNATWDKHGSEGMAEKGRKGGRKKK